MKNDSWDIEATFPPLAGKSKMQAAADRLPALLADRLHLTVHRETRQLPVYTLVVAKGGPKLTPSDPNDGKTQSLRILPPKDPAGFTAIKTDIYRFTIRLSTELNLPTIDRTGIRGIYDINLELHAAAPSRCAERFREWHLGFNGRSTATRSEARGGEGSGGSFGRGPR